MIKSTVFGSVRLSGKDAEKFQDQVSRGRLSKAAQESYQQGARLRAQYAKKGSVEIKPHKK